MTLLDVAKSETQTDLQFGKWIKREREIAGFAPLQVYKRTGILPHRIYELEWGIAKKGITMSEAKLLAGLYEVELSEITRRACGDFTNEEKL